MRLLIPWESVSWRNVYERALFIELNRRGIRAEWQVATPVIYKGESVGDYYVDVLVENRLILELKCVQVLTDEHLAQALNYLKATGHHVALLINFQHPKVEWRRVVQNF
jgi:GxxExxY protein